ncbi:hypothetical protein [Halobaculum roseum]|uniref:Small CPxCG-related zinc finger protein n=1 Tax=Halobaculum roseum TaxID=2175149 RepID=A0ABD5MLP2_9EURY|nr:hypothetical protein [Halobaculum roseum]QZY03892.1 hypothetical protein K6T36_06950 [Halobaculum roseum]
MERVDRAIFTCDDCGASAPSFGIEYDSLGYPVCPGCETAAGPLERRRVGGNSAATEPAQ